MKYEIVAFYKQEIEEIRECAENIGRLYGWRYRCEKIPGSGKLLSACMGEDSVLCLLKRKSYSFYRLMKYPYSPTVPRPIRPAIPIDTKDKINTYNLWDD